MRLHTTLVMVCLCVFAISAAAAQPLAEHLPAGTLIYAGWAGRNLTFDGSMMGRLLDEPAVMPLLTTVEQAIKSNLPAGQCSRLFTHGWAMCGIALQHPLAVALIDLPIGERGPSPAAAVLIDLGSDREAFDKHLQAILQSLAEETTVTEVTVGAVTYKLYQPQEGLEVAMGYKGDLFFATLGPGVAKRVIELTPAAALSAGKKFTDSFSGVTGDNEQLSVYVDVAALIDRLEPLLPGSAHKAEAGQEQISELRRIVNAIGLSNVKAIAGAIRIIDRGMYTKIRIISPAPHRGVLHLFAGEPLTDTDLAGVPEDADFVLACKLSPEAAYAELRRVVKAVSAEADEELAGGIAEAEKDLGISIRKDLLANLGEVCVLSSAASQGGFLTGTVLSVQVKDAEKLAAAVAKIEAFLQRESPDVKIETVPAGRTEIHYLRIGGGCPPVPFAPAWVIHKDRFYLAGWPQVVQAAVENHGKTALTGSDAFGRARGRITGNPSAISYTNTPQFVRQTYNLTLIIWTAGVNFAAGKLGQSIRPDWLPALPKLESYLWPQINAASSDAGGVTFEGYGSLPTTGLEMIPAGTAMLMPALGRARGEAKKAVSGANLNGIGKAVFLYAADHNDQPPKDLAPLVEENLISPRMLISPVSGREPPIYKDGKLIGGSDYVYLVLPADADGRYIRAYERPENYRGKGTWVLRADSSVQWLDMAQFKQALKETRDYLKSAAVPEDF
ncbi:MAG: hypothetical protein SVT52_01255 [Planctomycetota bacterium]|nr:hypothetical protein [Planctomycetota bacterium]